MKLVWKPKPGQTHAVVKVDGKFERMTKGAVVKPKTKDEYHRLLSLGFFEELKREARDSSTTKGPDVATQHSEVK